MESSWVTGGGWLVENYNNVKIGLYICGCLGGDRFQRMGYDVKGISEESTTSGGCRADALETTRDKLSREKKLILCKRSKHFPRPFFFVNDLKPHTPWQARRIMCQLKFIIISFGRIAHSVGKTLTHTMSPSRRYFTRHWDHTWHIVNISPATLDGGVQLADH